MDLQLIFNSDTSNFETSALCNDETYRISLLDFRPDEIDKATVLAIQIAQWIESNVNNIKYFTAVKLIELKNENWLEEDEEPVSKEKFVETITLDGVLAFSDGNFEIFFNDNDLFWGHLISLDVGKDFNLEDAGIRG